MFSHDDAGKGVVRLDIDERILIQEVKELETTENKIRKENERENKLLAEILIEARRTNILLRMLLREPGNFQTAGQARLYRR